MLYGVYADTYYEVEADSELEALDIALDLFRDYVPSQIIHIVELKK